MSTKSSSDAIHETQYSHSQDNQEVGLHLKNIYEEGELGDKIDRKTVYVWRTGASLKN